MSRRGRIVVLGMMSKMPVAGVVWQTVHYLVGLTRMGYETYYVEAHARTPSSFVSPDDPSGSQGAAAFIAGVMQRFGLEHRWAFHARHDDGAFYGLTGLQVRRLYRSADLLINLHGGTTPLPEHAETGRLVYLETDPVLTQVALKRGRQRTIDLLTPHVACFTFAENYGKPDCLVPVCEGFDFLPTRQPVVLDFWDAEGCPPCPVFTTVGNWRQPWRSFHWRRETYTWSKHLEFAKFLDLPSRTGQVFELALSSYDADDQRLLESHGWCVRDAGPLSRDPDTYRDYIRRSFAEFTAAKDQNVRLRSGWFSDRSATYLAAGRPVVTQETGFSNLLPSGEGLFGVETVEEAADAVAEIAGDYDRHSTAAKAIAREYFSHEVVLGDLLGRLGV